MKLDVGKICNKMPVLSMIIGQLNYSQSSVGNCLNNIYGWLGKFSGDSFKVIQVLEMTEIICFTNLLFLFQSIVKYILYRV